MWYHFQEHVCWYATLGCGVSLYRRHFVLDGVYLLTLYFWEVAPSKSHNTREVSLGRNAQTRRTGYLARATDTKHGVLSLFVKDKPLSYSVSAECGVSRPRSLWLRSQCVMFVFFFCDFFRTYSPKVHHVSVGRREMVSETLNL